MGGGGCVESQSTEPPPQCLPATMGDKALESQSTESPPQSLPATIEDKALESQSTQPPPPPVPATIADEDPKPQNGLFSSDPDPSASWFPVEAITQVATRMAAPVRAAAASTDLRTTAEEDGDLGLDLDLEEPSVQKKAAPPLLRLAEIPGGGIDEDLL